MDAMTASRGAIRAVTDDADPRRLPLPGRARGRLLRAGLGGRRSPGCSTHGADGAERIVCVLTGHGLKDPQTALDARRRRSCRASRSSPRSSAAVLGAWSAAGSSASPPRSANLGPGFDVLAAALALHLEVEVVETGRFAVETDLDDRARPPQPRRARVRARCTRPTTSRSASAPTSRCPAGWARARRRSSPACSPPTRSSSSTPTCSADATRARGPSRQRRRGAARRLRDLRRRRAPTRFDAPAGLEAVLVVPHERGPHGARRAPRCPREVPMADAVFNVAPRRAARARPRPRRLGPRRARARTTACTSRTARTCTRARASSSQRARELGALGATISGAGPTVLVWCDVRGDRRGCRRAWRRRPRAGRTCCACRSSRRAPRWCNAATPRARARRRRSGSRRGRDPGDEAREPRPRARAGRAGPAVMPAVQRADRGLVLAHGVAVRAVAEHEADARRAAGGSGAARSRARPARRARLGRGRRPPSGASSRPISRPAALDRRRGLGRRGEGAREPAAELAVRLRAAARRAGRRGAIAHSWRGRPRAWGTVRRSSSPASASAGAAPARCWDGARRARRAPAWWRAGAARPALEEPRAHRQGEEVVVRCRRDVHRSPSPSCRFAAYGHLSAFPC